MLLCGGQRTAVTALTILPGGGARRSIYRTLRWRIFKSHLEWPTTIGQGFYQIFSIRRRLHTTCAHVRRWTLKWWIFEVLGTVFTYHRITIFHHETSSGFKWWSCHRMLHLMLIMWFGHGNAWGWCSTWRLAMIRRRRILRSTHEFVRRRRIIIWCRSTAHRRWTQIGRRIATFKILHFR